MSKFSYTCAIGEYTSDVRVDITFSVKYGLYQEDYQKVRDAFAVIEKTAYKYADADEKVDSKDDD